MRCRPRQHRSARSVIQPLGVRIVREPPLFDVVFTDQPIRDYRSTLSGDADLMRRFNVLLRQRGILKGESKYYISLAHTDEDIAFTIDAWKSAIKELKA